MFDSFFFFIVIIMIPVFLLFFFQTTACTLLDRDNVTIAEKQLQRKALEITRFLIKQRLYSFFIRDIVRSFGCLNPFFHYVSSVFPFFVFLTLFK